MECESPFKRQRTTDPLYHDSNFNRHDESTVAHAHQLLSGLQQAITTKQRLNILRQLLHFVGYDPLTRHCNCHVNILSRLVEGKCIHLLCLQLGYTLNRRHKHHGELHDANEEVNLILNAMDIFYRYCPELVTESSIRNEGPEILHLLKEVLAYYRGGIIRDSAGRINFPRSSEMFLPIISIWHSCSSGNLGTMLLLQHPSTLQAVSNILSLQKEWSHQSSGGMEIIMESLGLLKNLSYYGEDYRHRIVDQTNLLTSLTSLTDVPNDKARERLSAVLRNLALSTDVRSRLIQRADVLTAIIRIINFSIPCSYTAGRLNINTAANICHTNTNCKKNTLRNVLSAVTSLAIDTNTTHLMVFHGDGILVEQLKQFVVHSEDFVIRKRAVRALRLLARDASSAPVMVLQDNQLLEILSDRTLNDVNDAVRMEAAEAFARCASLIRAPMTQHNYILEALTRMTITMTSTLTTTVINMDAVVRALQEQACYPENRISMAQKENLLEALAKIIQSDSTTFSAKESACATLLDLSEEELNHESIALPIILNALVQTLTDQDRILTANNAIGNNIANINTSITNKVRESSVRTILNLAKTQSNWKTMAKQTALIQSLLRFAAATTTREDAKNQVKEVILQLAAEL
mmetsp:Transcript_68707/g.76854  ORF Transcript_68707/g.76854 Transcript_68707/m.76854 type:complete len:636 (-) Transcript_68707:80-1987(-)